MKRWYVKENKPAPRRGDAMTRISKCPRCYGSAPRTWDMDARDYVAKCLCCGYISPLAVPYITRRAA